MERGSRAHVDIREDTVVIINPPLNSVPDFTKILSETQEKLRRIYYILSGFSEVAAKIFVKGGTWIFMYFGKGIEGRVNKAIEIESKLETKNSKFIFLSVDFY